MGKVEWSRRVDSGRVQRPDDIVNFETRPIGRLCNLLRTLVPSHSFLYSNALRNARSLANGPQSDMRRLSVSFRKVGSLTGPIRKSPASTFVCASSDASTALGSWRWEHLESSRERSQRRAPQWDAVSVNISAIASPGPWPSSSLGHTDLVQSSRRSAGQGRTPLGPIPLALCC